MDSCRSPSILKRNQYALGVNLTCRGGFPKPRPALKRLIEQLPSGMFQRAGFYGGGSQEALMVSIAGRIYRIPCDTFTSAEVTPQIVSGGVATADPNNATRRIGWWQSAENYMIYQDGQKVPIIWDGTSCRRSHPELSEVPMGTVMGYIMGRLVVALPNRREFVIGDLAGSDGTAKSVLKFTETGYYSEGGSLITNTFGAPPNMGPISAIVPVADLNTSLGQGPAFVGCPNGIFSLNLPFDRNTWKEMGSPLKAVAALNQGMTGQESTIQVNGDIWYRRLDGVGTMINAVRYFDQPGNVPISSEMDRIVSKDDVWLLEWASGAYYDNRFLLTCSPSMGDSGVAWRGLMVADFDLISTLQGKLSPVWESVWTMPDDRQILQVVRGVVDNVDRCFVFALSPDGVKELWELHRTDEYTTDEDDTRISWVIEGRSDDHGSPFDLKRLMAGDLWLDRLDETVDITVYYREDKQSCWRTWWTDTVCAKMEECDLDPLTCETPPMLQRQVRPKIRLPQPPDVDDAINGKPTRLGYEFQTRIEITGYCRLLALRTHAIEEQEPESYELAEHAT